MRFLSWDEFNVCIKTISQACRDENYLGVYGVPRGGLCLAVALSHSLGIPLLLEPRPRSLVVDDVYETGMTLSNYRELPGSRCFVWLSKSKPDWWHAFEVTNSKEWIIFPWENVSKSLIEEKTFRASRTFHHEI